MGLISRTSMFFDQRKKEVQHLTKLSQDLVKLSAKLRSLDVKKKLELFEGVTVCLETKIHHMHNSIQKIDSPLQILVSRLWSQIAIQEPEPFISPRLFWNPKASVVINIIKKSIETYNSSTIKTERSKHLK